MNTHCQSLEMFFLRFFKGFSIRLKKQLLKVCKFCHTVCENIFVDNFNIYGNFNIDQNVFELHALNNTSTVEVYTVNTLRTPDTTLCSILSAIQNNV